jgi:hypothetical protein
VCGIVIAAAQKPLCENFVVSEIAANCLQRKGLPVWGSPFRLDHRVIAFLSANRGDPRY